MTLNYLSLFSGIGGLDLGLDRAGMHCVGQVELDDYCRRVLAKHWPDVPRHDDVRTAAEWWLSTERPAVDVICGGFPCQDISVAGKRAGIIDGERSSLWTYMAHTVRLLRPRYVLVENVPRVLVRGRDGVIPAEVIAADLATLGYDLRWDCVPAAAVGARHRRDRWFGIAHTNRGGVRVEPVAKRGRIGETVVGLDGKNRHLAYAAGLEGRRLRGATAERGPRTGELADPESERRRQGRQGRSVGDGADWSAVWPQALAHTQGQRRWPSGAIGAEQAGPDALAGSAGQLGGSHAWAVEPRMGRTLDGFSSWLDESGGLAEAHKLILAYANATETGPEEVLRTLRNSTGTEDDRRAPGGPGGLSSAQVLLAILRELENRCGQAGEPLAGTQAPEVCVRELWPYEDIARPPLRWQPGEQRSVELADSVQSLSQLLARAAGQAWAAYRRSDAGSVGWGWEDGVDRVVTGFPSRLDRAAENDRIRALGNAVVPQVAEHVGRIIVAHDLSERAA